MEENRTDSQAMHPCITTMTLEEGCDQRDK
jgi:hypothetical protein